MNFRRHFQQPTIPLTLINFIDILLVLTVFLMTNFAFSPRETSVEVNLPKSSSAATPTRQSSSLVVVNVNREGQFVLNSQIVSSEQLKAKLAKLKALVPDTVVVIRADSNAAYQSVLNVIDLCGTLQIEHVGFAAKKEQ